MTSLPAGLSVDVADAVEQAGWETLLPAHRLDGEALPTGRPRCVDLVALGESQVLAVVVDDTGGAYPVPIVVDPSHASSLRRAVPGDGASEALLRLLAAGSRSVGAFELTSWHQRPAAGERAVGVDQTNESVVVGDAAVVKWVVLAEEGPHPAPLILAQLDRSGFRGTPLPWGAVQWRPETAAPPRLLALVTQFLPGAVDGWAWVVDELGAAADRGDPAQPAEAGRRVGSLVADLHVALAPTARAATREEADGWRTSAHADLDRALDTASGAAQALLVHHEAEVRAVFDRLPRQAGPPVLRVHGDLHVGQVLRAGSAAEPAYAITDFDGNPVVPAAERLREQPAAVDVAGMAQSLMHAGLVVGRHRPSVDAAALDRVVSATVAAFLDAYRHGLGEHASLYDERLLKPLALRQVCREFTYAATHLPRWSYVPEAALPRLLGKEAR